MCRGALKRKLNKDISFALRRGTIAQVTTLLALDRRATSPPSALSSAEAKDAYRPVRLGLRPNDEV